MTTSSFSVVGDRVLIHGTRCKECDYRWFPSNEFGCEQCGAFGERLEAVRFGGRGRLVSFARVPEADAAFVLASVALDEGPVVRGIVLDMKDDSGLGIGDPVQACLDEAGEVRFRIADADANEDV